MIYTVSIIICCLLALIGTLYVAKNPKDDNYGTVNRRIKNLSIFYGISTLLMLAGFVAYLFG